MFSVELSDEELQDIIFSAYYFRISCTKFSFIMSKYIFLLELAIFGIAFFIKKTMSNNKDTTNLFIVFGMIFTIHLLVQLRSTKFKCNNNKIANTESNVHNV